MTKYRTHDEVLAGELVCPEFAAEYLTACLADGGLSQFLRGLRQVADAQGGIGALSKAVEQNRQNLYRVLSEAGNPQMSNVLEILSTLRIRVRFEADEGERKAA